MKNLLFQLIEHEHTCILYMNVCTCVVLPQPLLFHFVIMLVLRYVPHLSASKVNIAAEIIATLIDCIRFFSRFFVWAHRNLLNVSKKYNLYININMYVARTKFIYISASVEMVCWQLKQFEFIREYFHWKSFN